ncbi:MAG TPA: helix-turn-helix transcriptional regulator [Candidatus Elarobacter sp.]|jgi:predicted XRE-type DNA-binding protein|nr:helix-turn-helix transcriptional regulator [Candidatus Elarobacter sp.]
MIRKRSKRKGDFLESGGNVFSDLGLENADELLVKADLMHTINREIRRRALTQQQAAERVNMSQSDISNIARGKAERYSQERLLDVLRHLGLDVEIRFHRRARGGIGTLRVRELA